MPLLKMNEGEIEIPQGWEDKSIHVLSCPAGAREPAASLSITRNSPDGASGLGDYIDKQLTQMTRLFPRFRLLSREEAAVDGQPAEHLAFTWRSENGVTLRQEQTVVLLSTGTVMVFTATAPRDKYHQYAEAFHDIVGNYRFGNN